MIVRLLLGLIKVYQRTISPLMPARCRYYPTCSQYGIYALRWYGVRGVPLLIGRLLRCQPWGGSGVDLLPISFKHWRFMPSSASFRVVYKDMLSYSAMQNHLMKG